MADDVIRFTTPDPAEGPPIPFDLEFIRLTTIKHEEPPADASDEDRASFQPWVEKKQERETKRFHAVPDLSGGVLVQIDLMIASNRAGSANGVHVRGGDALFDFLEAMVVEEERRDFMDLIHAPDIYVHSQVLTDIALHFYRAYTGRPTKPPAS